MSEIDKITAPTPAFKVYESAWFFTGYSGKRCVCALRLYQPQGADEQGDLPAAIAIFTETANNAEGTSITNRIEALTQSVWGFLRQPEKPPIVIEHYPNRGCHNPSTGVWQFPETFKRVDFEHGEDGSFKKPRWTPISKEAVEILIGQTLETRK
jgi:hypothetical protein